MTIDYYRVLNLPHDATLDQIHSAFRSLAREYHPDRNRGSRAGEAASHMVLINEAYTCLSDSSRRRGYDESLRIAEPPCCNAPYLMGPKTCCGGPTGGGWKSAMETRSWKVENGGCRFVLPPPLAIPN